ncbi:MAG: hypothetical protein B1H05_02400 [Candidatus Cloacimonas sp. 4484_140]|nr:MAG: hypothetical protein B1H05_02400 [Candidatus Cloacimonas sp. 4484_140]HHI87728.1 DUF2179 domain-containing protein [Candidatus Cloacimonadota bacterium]
MFSDSGLISYALLPFLIFISRVFDVSLGTLRIIFVNRGMKFLAPIIGFFEVFIWLVVIGQVMQNLTNITNYIAYAGGFAMGNFVGIFLEQKLAMGIVLLRIITMKKARELIAHFRGLGYRVTNIPATANDGKVEIIFLPVKRKDIRNVIAAIKKYNENALYTFEDVRALSEWAIPKKERRRMFPKLKAYPRLFRFKRKSK